ncbi:MAG: DUF4286 family protein [Nitrososphaerota archaeon]|jgi:hypothetical protein|nr:DUF4286 family protein [Nitrososphaerota archaeon]MDG6923624.1 DUF4286 family protein [Nitrososphaerota archaeon]
MKRGKVLYLAWVDVEPKIEDAWNKWMNEVHVPEVLKEGRFDNARRFVIEEGEAPGKYVNMYEAKDLNTYKAYFDGPNVGIRTRYAALYGETTKVKRTILRELSCE